MKMKKLLIIDGHSILNRAFYGLPDLTNHEGIHTNAILGFLNIIFKIMEEEQPDHMCVAFDVHQPTFRHIRYEAYKGTRSAMPEELRQQVPLMKEVLASMNITTMEKGGYEADDLIGTLSRVADAEGYKVVIVSGDRDLLQLATDDILVRIPKTKAGGTTVENYYAKDVEELYGVNPVQFIDMKGLMGDTSDNIPGVPGIGPKTASKIIAQYGSLENAIEHVDEIKPPKAQKNLAEFKEQAILSKELATIKLDCELDYTLEDMIIEDIYNENFYQMCKRFEFKSLLKKFDNIQETAVDINPVISQYETKEAIASLFVKLAATSRLGVYVISYNDSLLGLAVADSAAQVHIINCTGNVEQEYINEEFLKLAVAGVTICFMDLKKSLPYLSFGEAYKNVIDIGLGAYLLNPLASEYLYDEVARDYLNVSLPSEKEIIGKEEPNMFTFTNEEFMKVYSYKAVVPYMVYERIMSELSKKEMTSLYMDIELPTVYTLYDMEARGIRVDRDALNQYSKKLQTRIDELHAAIIAAAGHEFNINSPKQLGQVLFEEMKLSGGKKTKTGYSTSVDVLEKIKNDNPIIQDILEYRQLTKLNSTYAAGLPEYISEDGRIHGTFNQTITATGRISSTEPNLQNIPMRMELGRLIRKAFIPQEGYVFLDADYSQIELRVLAHLADDEVMQNAFLNNVDIHSTTASEVFDVPIDQVSALQRRNAKAVNFGIVYGISAFGLSEDLGISRKEASEYIDKYFETYKGIKTYLDTQVDIAKKEGCVATMFGRIRPIPEIKSSNFMQRSFGERVAMNSPIQGTAADIIKIAMINVNMELKEKKLKSRLILQIHDELLIETAIDEIEEVREILTRQMMTAAELKVPLAIDVEQGDTWYNAHT
jgi:DNA polymerase-1